MLGLMLLALSGCAGVTSLRMQQTSRADETRSAPSGDAAAAPIAKLGLAKPGDAETQARCASRLLRTGTWLGLGPGPVLDRREELDPSITTVGKLDGGAVVLIGSLPLEKQP